MKFLYIPPKSHERLTAELQEYPENTVIKDRDDITYRRRGRGWLNSNARVMVPTDLLALRAPLRIGVPDDE